MSIRPYQAATFHPCHERRPVSCLAALTRCGFAIADARLYDMFAGTHRVEAAVALDRESAR